MQMAWQAVHRRGASSHALADNRTQRATRAEDPPRTPPLPKSPSVITESLFGREPVRAFDERTYASDEVAAAAKAAREWTQDDALLRVGSEGSWTSSPQHSVKFYSPRSGSLFVRESMQSAVARMSPSPSQSASPTVSSRNSMRASTPSGLSDPGRKSKGLSRRNSRADTAVGQISLRLDSEYSKSQQNLLREQHLVAERKERERRERERQEGLQDARMLRAHLETKEREMERYAEDAAKAREDAIAAREKAEDAERRAAILEMNLAKVSKSSNASLINSRRASFSSSTPEITEVAQASVATRELRAAFEKREAQLLQLLKAAERQAAHSRDAHAKEAKSLRAALRRATGVMAKTTLTAEDLSEVKRQLRHVDRCSTSTHGPTFLGHDRIGGDGQGCHSWGGMPSDSGRIGHYDRETVASGQSARLDDGSLGSCRGGGGGAASFVGPDDGEGDPVSPMDEEDEAAAHRHLQEALGIAGGLSAGEAEVLREKLRRAEKALEEERAAARADIDRLQAEAVQNARLQGRVSLLGGRRGKRDKKASVEDVNMKEISRLRAELAEARDQAGRAREEHAKNMSGLRDDLRRAHNECDDVCAERDELRERLAVLEASIRDLQGIIRASRKVSVPVISQATLEQSLALARAAVAASAQHVGADGLHAELQVGKTYAVRLSHEVATALELEEMLRQRRPAVSVRKQAPEELPEPPTGAEVLPSGQSSGRAPARPPSRTSSHPPSPLGSTSDQLRWQEAPPSHGNSLRRAFADADFVEVAVMASPILGSLTAAIAPNRPPPETAGIAVAVKDDLGWVVKYQVLEQAGDGAMDVRAYGMHDVALATPEGGLVAKGAVMVTPPERVRPSQRWEFFDALNNDRIRGMETRVRDAAGRVTAKFAQDDIELKFGALPDGVTSIEVSSENYETATLRFLKFGSLTRREVVDSVFFNRRGTLVQGQMRVVLAWSDHPADLDLHCVSSKGGHVYWSNKSAGEMTIDIDVTKGQGPETLTLDPRPGRSYRVFVHNYTASKADNMVVENDLALSVASVQLFDGTGGLPLQWEVPTNPVENRLYWNVFTLFAGDDGVVRVEASNELLTVRPDKPLPPNKALKHASMVALAAATKGHSAAFDMSG